MRSHHDWWLDGRPHIETSPFIAFLATDNFLWSSYEMIQQSISQYWTWSDITCFHPKTMWYFPKSSCPSQNRLQTACYGPYQSTFNVWGSYTTASNTFTAKFIVKIMKNSHFQAKLSKTSKTLSTLRKRDLVMIDGSKCIRTLNRTCLSHRLRLNCFSAGFEHGITSLLWAQQIIQTRRVCSKRPCVMRHGQFIATQTGRKWYFKSCTTLLCNMKFSTFLIRVHRHVKIPKKAEILYCCKTLRRCIFDVLKNQKIKIAKKQFGSKFLFSKLFFDFDQSHALL